MLRVCRHCRHGRSLHLRSLMMESSSTLSVEGHVQAIKKLRSLGLGPKAPLASSFRTQHHAPFCFLLHDRDTFTSPRIGSRTLTDVMAHRWTLPAFSHGRQATTSGHFFKSSTPESSETQGLKLRLHISSSVRTPVWFESVILWRRVLPKILAVLDLFSSPEDDRV